MSAKVPFIFSTPAQIIQRKLPHVFYGAATQSFFLNLSQTLKAHDSGGFEIFMADS